MNQDVQPFHDGERAVQERVGVREKMAAVGRRVIRSFMPDHHREFFAQLPFLIVGTVDANDQPWASVLANPPGFIESPDPHQLVIRARALAGDPLVETLRPGASIGLLGIEPHTRRRNRMNGVVQRVSSEAFSVRVRQSFGNCPKYIQARKPEFASSGAAIGTTVHASDRLDAAARQMILRADTFFIATAHPAADGDDDSAHGVDVSHRGGKPGFVRVDGADTLTAPDFTGNAFFNTLGNIALDPRAGLLFIDFEAGALLYLAVHAEIIWEGAEVDAFEGAERLLRLRVREARRVEGSLPLRWGEAQRSPFLESTGEWATVAGT
jgi:predicted pyridoxine 5'-phosphate oxidase superfamily flavin-nucleotide-binding protein